MERRIAVSGRRRGANESGARVQRRLADVERRLREIGTRPRGSVHDVRVVMKILKAGLRLVGRDTPGVDKRLRRLRAHGRALTAVRDAEAQREIIGWLRARGLRVPRPRVATAPGASARIEARVRRAAADAVETVEFLEVVLRERSVAHLERGLKRSDRRIENARRRLADSATEDNLHTLRKRIKDRQHQLRYFAPHATRDARERERLKRVGHNLGLVRDLQRLHADIASSARGAADRDRLAAIDAVTQRRRRHALRSLS